MCYLGLETTTRIKNVIAALVSRKKRFTGWDVANVAASNGIVMEGATPKRSISEKVRELFNAHDPCFNGYACYPVVGGPLLYFYAGADVLRRGQAILDAIEASAPNTL